MEPKQPHEPDYTLQTPESQPVQQGPTHHFPDSALAPAPPRHRLNQGYEARRKGRSKLAIMGVVIGIVVLLAGLSAGIYFVFLKPKPSEKKQTTTQTSHTDNQTATSSPAASNTPPSAASTLKSTKLNLEVTKPTGWSGSEDPTSGELTLTSPSTTYTAKDGSKTGVFVLKIRQGADTDGQAMIHGANAVKDAETIGYSAPTDNQRFYTNIAVAGQSDMAQFVIVTSADQPKKGESLSRMLINNDVYVILGGFREASKTGLTGFDLISVNTFTASNQYEQAVGIIKSLKIF